MNQMPSVINRDAVLGPLSPAEREFAIQVFRGKTGQIRATKPKDGRAAYIWRMVVFQVSTNPQHHSMPMTADFGILPEHYAHRTETYQPRLQTEGDREAIARWDAEPGGRESGRTWTMMNRSAKEKAYIRDELDPIVDAIVNQIPKNEWHGIRRWGQALGAAR